MQKGDEVTWSNRAEEDPYRLPEKYGDGPFVILETTEGGASGLLCVIGKVIDGQTMTYNTFRREWQAAPSNITKKLLSSLEGPSSFDSLHFKRI